MRRLVLPATCVVVAALALSGCSAGKAAAKPSPLAAGASYHGVEPEPVPSRPEFVLTDTNGDRYDFMQQTQGRPTFVYFGYTHCPDECPTAMADVAAALRR